MIEDMNNENTNQNKSKIAIKIVLVLIVIALIIGISYAYFSAKRKSGEFSITTSGFEISFEKTSEIILDNAYPIREDEIEEKAYSNNFTLTNNGEKDIYVSLYLSDITLSEEFETNPYDIKWALYEGDSKITTGTFISHSDYDNINILSEILIPSSDGNTRSYTLRVWINETPDDQNNLQSGSLSGKIEAVAQLKSSNTLASHILGNNNSNVKDGEYNFNNDYTIDDSSPTIAFEPGLYVQKDSKTEFGFPTYYYRGDVKNNYVEFGTYKEDIGSSIKIGNKIIWRIVRINEDGSIKLIASDVAKMSMFNKSGYPRYINDDDLASEAKTSVDEWYKTNIKEESLDKKVQKSAFCNDITDEYSAVYNRLKTDDGNVPTPIFNCPNGSIVAKEKAGLITADEAVYAGYVLSSVNGSIYLANGADTFLTMSPYKSSTTTSPSVMYIIGTNMSSIASNISAHNTRVVINLRGDVSVASGEGTSESPFVLK